MLSVVLHEPCCGLTSGSWSAISRNSWSSSRMLVDDPRRSPQIEYMLHGFGDPALAIAGKLTVSNGRRTRSDRTYIMFDDQLLGHVLEISLAHPLKPISDVFLDKVFRFRNYTFGILSPVIIRIIVGSHLWRLRRGNS